MNVAYAGDLMTVRSCVQRGYEAMSDRKGIVAAVLDANDSQILTFGTATQEQLFEIGSITKTFTANLLAQAVVESLVSLSDSIPAAYQKPGNPITYQHLTTHTSGIRAGNFPDYNSGNPLAPYEGMTPGIFKDLYAKTPLVSEPGQAWAYSNLGTSLLGMILSENAGADYEELVRKKIFAPLGMTDSYFRVPAAELSRLPQGHVIINKSPAMAAPFWDLSENALKPAGGIRSSIKDMITFARANLVPESSPLAIAVTLSQVPLFKVSPSMSIAMNWLIDTDRDVVWHYGATGGFNAVVALSKKHNQAVVALSNTAAYVIDAKGNPDFEMSFDYVALDCLK